MKIRVTSITNSEVGELINNVTTRVEDQLRPAVELEDYGGGIEQLTVFFVSVDSDPIENERYCVANNRASTYRDMFSGKTVRFVGIAVPVDPQIVLSSSKEALARLMRDLLFDELTAPAYAMPKKFDRARLLADLKTALA